MNSTGSLAGECARERGLGAEPWTRGGNHLEERGRGGSRWVGGGPRPRAPGPASQGPAQALTLSKMRPTTVLSF